MLRGRYIVHSFKDNCIYFSDIGFEEFANAVVKFGWAYIIGNMNKALQITYVGTIKGFYKLAAVEEADHRRYRKDHPEYPEGSTVDRDDVVRSLCLGY